MPSLLLVVALLATPPADEPVPEITLEADVTQLVAEKHRADRPLRPGVLRLQRDGATVEVAVELRTRGRSRTWGCRLPPFELRLAEPVPEVAGDGTRAHLVPDCDPPGGGWTAARRGERMVRELLGYRYYRETTDVALDARLVRLQWRDTGRRKLGATAAFALVVEEFDHLATRTGLERFEPKGDPGLLDDAALARFNAFELFVLNQDFDLRQDQRNGLLLRDPAAGRSHPVPFDFDKARLTWGVVFSADTWLRSVLCKPGYWKERSGLTDPATQRAALEKMRSDLGAMAVLTNRYAALIPETGADALRAQLGAFHKLLEGPAGDGSGVDLLMKRCFGAP